MPSGLGDARSIGASARRSPADWRARQPRPPLLAGNCAPREPERLVQRSRLAVYHTPPKSTTVREFASHGYWRRVRERPGLLIAALACLFVPTFLAGYWAWRDPGPASGLVPSEYQAVTQPREPGHVLDLGACQRRMGHRGEATCRGRVG